MTECYDWIRNSSLFDNFLKIIQSEYPHIDVETLVNQFGCSVHSLITNAKLRSIRRNHCELEIDRHWCLETFVSQCGRCNYNEKLLLEFQRADNINHNYRMSLERLDQSIGYTKENSVLICLQYNGRFQITKEIINELANGRTKEQTIVNIRDRVKKRKSGSKRTMKKKRKVLPGNNIICYNCNVILPVAEFRTMKSSFARKDGACNDYPSRHCRPCSNLLRKEQVLNEVRSNIYCLLGSARGHSKQKLKQHKKKCSDLNCQTCCNWGVEIDFEWVLQQFEAQNGRCAYSEHPLHVLPGSAFSMSIERVDDEVDYNKSNSVLICRALQVGMNVKWTKESFTRDHQHLMVAN